MLCDRRYGRSAVDRAVVADILQLRKELEDLSHRLTEAEQCMSSLEDDQYQNNAAMEQYTQA